MKTNNPIKLLILILFYFTNLGFVRAQDNKPIAFITGAGSTYREADVNAHNTAYMNGLKIVSKSVSKSGGIWIITVKTVPRY